MNPPPLTDNPYGNGVVSMARNCKSSVELVRRGQWDLDKMDRWLDSVINNDMAFLNEVRPEIEAKCKQTASERSPQSTYE
jgi:hypothetical protein